MDIASLQAYGYFGLVVFMVVVLYSYIYFLYKVKKDSSGIDFEQYSNMALHDDLDDALVSARSDEKALDESAKRK